MNVKKRRTGAPGEAEWFAQGEAAPASASRPLAALPASGLYLYPGVLVQARHGAEQRLPLADVASIDLDVRVRPLRLAALAAAACIASIASFLVLRDRYLDITLAPLALAALSLRRATLAAALEIELRAGAHRRLSLSYADALRLRRAGRTGPSFLETVRGALDRRTR